MAERNTTQQRQISMIIQNGLLNKLDSKADELGFSRNTLISLILGKYFEDSAVNERIELVEFKMNELEKMVLEMKYKKD